MLLYLLILSLGPVLSLESKNLHYLSQCLSQCAQCNYNELNSCKQTSSSLCIANYNNINGSCKLDSSYYNQLQYIHQNGQFKFLQKWEYFQQTQCQYKHANGQTQYVNLIGLFQASSQNKLNIIAQPYHQSLLISFNLVRNSWVPFQDFLQMNFVDQKNNSLDKYIIQYYQRNLPIEHQTHTLNCGEQKFIVQKFQILVNLKHKNITKISILIKGLMQNNERWGFTNVKVAFGCRNNLLFFNGSCHNCEIGYYLNNNDDQSLSPVCMKCPFSCISCNKDKCFACIEGMILNGTSCQSSVNHKSIQKIKFQQLTQFCGNQIYQSYKIANTSTHVLQQQVHIDYNHTQARIIFTVFFVQSQWIKQTDTLILQVGGSKVLQIKKQNVTDKLKQKCQQSEGVTFSRLSIFTPFFKHNVSIMEIKLYSNDQNIIHFGIQDLNLQIKVDLVVKQTVQQNKSKKQIDIPTNQSNTKQIVNIIPQHANNTQKTEVKEPAGNINIRNQIQRITPMISQITLTHTITQPTKDTLQNELLISINYPMDINTYPYIYCQFNKSKLRVSGKMIKTTSHLQYVAVQISESLLNQTVTVIMTSIQKLISYKEAKESRRLLQNLQNRDQVQLGKIFIQRFDVLSQKQLSSYFSFQIFFTVIAHIVLILTIILVMIGKAHVIIDLTISLQILFLHAYIFSQSLPLSFRIPISGLQNVQNLNYFHKAAQEGIEKWLMGDVLQQSPIRFMQFNSDINFTRAIYPIIIINLIFVTWFLLVLLINILITNCLKLQSKQSKQQMHCNMQHLNSHNVTQSKHMAQNSIIYTIHKYTSCIVSRPLNYWHFVFKYQFLTIFWISFLQFYNLSYPPGANRNQIINAVFCITTLSTTVLIPLLTYIWMRRQYIKLDYEKYISQYSQIFQFQLYQLSLPSHSHHYYMLLQPIKLIICCLCCSYLATSPLQALIILISIHFLHAVFLKFAKPIINTKFTWANYILNFLFIVLEIGMIVAYGTGQYFTTTQYLALGYFLIVISVLIILAASTMMIYRFAYNFADDFNQQKSFKNQLAVQRVV